MKPGLSLADWKRAMRFALDEGLIEPLTDWPSFSQNLVNIYFGDTPELYRIASDEALIDVMDAESGTWTERYKRIYRSYWKLMGSDPVPVARGLSGLCLPSEQDFWTTVFETRRSEIPDTSYSLNVAFASRFFANLHKSARFMKPSYDDLDTDASNWARAEMSWTRCAQEYMERHGGTLRKALMITESPAMICSRIRMPSGAWGGDSESGSLQEAEIRVGRYPIEDIEKVFVLTTNRIGPMATSAERTTYALGRHLEVTMKAPPYMNYWGKSLKVVLHPRTDLRDSPYVSSVKEVDEDYPLGHRWRRIHG